MAGVQKVKERLDLKAAGKLDKKLSTWLDVNTIYSVKENQRSHWLQLLGGWIISNITCLIKSPVRNSEE